MRLLPSWETVTGSAPRRDHSGHWFLTEASVHALRDDADLYRQLAGIATKWKDDMGLLQEENKKLKKEIRKLKKELKNATS